MSRPTPYGPYDQPHVSPYGAAGGMSREELEAEVARLRAAEGVPVTAPAGPLEIDHSSPTPPPPPAPATPAARKESADEKLDRLQAEAAAAEVEDYGAFWAEQGGGKTLKNVHGRDLQLPRAMPLRYEMESRRLQDRQDVDAVKYLFDILFGTGTWDDLIARGADAEQLPVLLVWGTSNLSGSPMTLAQARAKTHEMAAAKNDSDGGAGAAGNGPAPAAAGAGVPTPGVSSAAAGA